MRGVDNSMMSSDSSKSSVNSIVEAYNNADYERLAIVVRQMWGEEESELRQNIFASFVLADEQ